ncbi:MAG: hypothetical protein AVDCRST_MAG38-1401, partial [uncultured Solirubrobacteraceae bacterium]
GGTGSATGSAPGERPDRAATTFPAARACSASSSGGTYGLHPTRPLGV